MESLGNVMKICYGKSVGTMYWCFNKLWSTGFLIFRDVRLHEQDLESNLHYSLRHEVAMFASIGNIRLVALKQYVKALAKVLFSCFPSIY